MRIIILFFDFLKSRSLLSFVMTIPTFAILYLFLRALYRISFHPLRAFPGPKLRAISHLPDAIEGLMGRQAAAVRDLHTKYGEVVRIKPDTLAFMTPESFKDIHGHAATKKFKKYGYFKFRGAQPITLADGEIYHRQRAALAHGFSERAISGQEKSITKHIDRFVRKLRTFAARNEKVDMSEWLHFLTFDVIGEFALDMQFECVKNSQKHPWLAILMKWIRAVSYASNANKFGRLAPILMIFANVKDLLGFQTHLKISAEKVQERLKADDSTKSDLWAYVLRNDGEKSLSQEEMEVNAATLLVAGSVPISDTLCGAVYLLAKNQDALRKLQRELRTFNHEENLTMSSTAKLPYLQAVLSESLRCYPSSTGSATRKAPPEGATVSGHFVPGGTVVGIYALPTFTSPENFAVPNTILPDRWLPADHPDRPRATLNDKQDALQPFGFGPRCCLGKGLANAEMKLILARFVWNFDFELLDDGFAIEKQRSFLFRERPPLIMKLKDRW